MGQEVSIFRDPALETHWNHACGFAEERGLFERLKTVYDSVPEGQCSGCTACCSESVNTFFIEWLQIYQTLQKNGRWPEALRRAEKYAEDELALPMKCPMLEPDGRCMVYWVRPLTCRVFGHLREADYMKNYAAVLKANRQSAKAILKKYHVEVPLAVVERQIPFCRDFQSEAPMTLKARDEMAEQLFSIDSRFFAEGLLEADQIQLGLVDWFTMVRMDMEAIGKMRIQRVVEVNAVKK
jgi:Fe-S-cluster containining protein